MKKILLFIAFTSYGFSQGEITSLSIDEAIEYGIKNNRNLLNAEREILMAYNEKWKTIATGLPQITAKLDYSNYIELPTSLIPLEKFGMKVMSFGFISGRTPWGVFRSSIWT